MTPGRWLGACTLWILTAQSSSSTCVNETIGISVILLDDGFDWSLKYARGQILRAKEKINAENLSFTLKVNFAGIDTSYYQKTGCESSMCEGVAEFKYLREKKILGCAVLGPTCTISTYEIADGESGLKSRTPLLSAGSFGLKCDGTKNLQRLLPPALKTSKFFVEFWDYNNNLKDKWQRAYVYTNETFNQNAEDCLWYMDALKSGNTEFEKNVATKIVGKSDWKTALAGNRTSNLFIMCGSPADIESLKRDFPEADNSELLFFLIDLYNDQYYRNPISKPCMRNVLVLTMPDHRMYNISDNPKMNDFMAAYHDAVLFIGEVLKNINNGSERTVDPSVYASLNASLFRNTTFKGIAGTYRMDPQGDRDVTFSIIYTTMENKFKTLFTFDTETSTTVLMDENPHFIWEKTLPKDAPNMDPQIEWVIISVLGVTVVVVGTIAFIFYRQNRKDRRQKKRWSHLDSNMVTLLEENEHGEVNLKIEKENKKKIFKIRRALYDKKMIILKELKHSDGNFNETQMMELNALLHIDYYSLTKFYGTVQFDQGVFGLYEYGEKGSLKYVLNDKVSYPEGTFMDWEFKISVMYDIAKGMSYLHASDLQVHGRLKSTNCVVNNRMVVKITDFGCNSFLVPGRDLWTAPEHLRNQGTSQKGDIYSFAIIAQEIIFRKCTFYTEGCSDRAEKLSRVQSPGDTVFRPDLHVMATDTDSEVYTLIKSCWDEDPERRPDFKKVENCLEKIISKIHNHDNESYMDNMIRRLQMYSRNLENLVEERTKLYKYERDRADNLNYMLLPGPVVKSLKETGSVAPELYEEVTIYFSDIVGFTTLCQYSTPMEVVDMLNDIYQSFDSIVDRHDVYKVETIGDAYMVTSGLPKRNGNRHAVDICHMALDILAFMGNFQLRHLPGIPVWIRIGVHSGPCAAGVVGVKMPRYCLFGDTVNTASRMESTGHPLKIHVSQPTIDILKRTDTQFEYEYRGETFLKGKGAETTYWLTGVRGTTFDLPTPPTAENFQRQQQELAQMVVDCLDRRFRGSLRRKRALLLSQSSEDQEHRPECDREQPEYLHLASVDNTLSTFL